MPPSCSAPVRCSGLSKQPSPADAHSPASVGSRSRRPQRLRAAPKSALPTRRPGWPPRTSRCRPATTQTSPCRAGMKLAGLCGWNRGNSDTATIQAVAIRRGTNSACLTTTPTMTPAASSSRSAGKTNTGISQVSPPVLLTVIPAAVAKMAPPAAHMAAPTPARCTGIRRPALPNNPTAAATRDTTVTNPHRVSGPVPGNGRALQASPRQPPRDTNKVTRPAPPITQNKPLSREITVAFMTLPFAPPRSRLPRKPFQGRPGLHGRRSRDNDQAQSGF